MAKSSHEVTTGVTSEASPIRKGNQRARNVHAIISAAAKQSATISPNRPDSAPHTAEPSANEPSAQRTCSATARARTQGGALVWVAVLNVDITAIQDAPAI